MKRKNLIPSLILIALLLAMLLPGCQNPTAHEASAPTISEPLAAESTVNPSDATEITDVPATELPEPDTESTLATEAPDETQIEPETTAPTEPKATEPKSSEPKPAEPKPSESKPAEPKPSESKPTEPKPSEPKPSQPKPSETKPSEPKPSEPKPSESKPTEPPHTHSWGAWKQTKAPTCASSGEEARSCACGATETRPVAATGKHSWQETSPTCTQEGVKTCTVCGKKETIAALGHDWVHHDEEGHSEAVIKCYCGMVFSSEAEWWDHFMQYDGSDEMDNHAGHSDSFPWVVDKPAYDVCSRCGAVK